MADPTLLFRFSAVTANAHRIHYDQPYATGIEGYPDLVVHGPLTAILLAELARHAPWSGRAARCRTEPARHTSPIVDSGWPGRPRKAVPRSVRCAPTARPR